MIARRVVKRVNPKTSHRKENRFFFKIFSFFLFLLDLLRRWMLDEPTVVLISKCMYIKPSCLYTLNLYSDNTNIFSQNWKQKMISNLLTITE